MYFKIITVLSSRFPNSTTYIYFIAFPNGSVCLFHSDPFPSILIHSLHSLPFSVIPEHSDIPVYSQPFSFIRNPFPVTPIHSDSFRSITIHSDLFCPFDTFPFIRKHSNAREWDFSPLTKCLCRLKRFDKRIIKIIHCFIILKSRLNKKKQPTKIFEDKLGVLETREYTLENNRGGNWNWSKWVKSWE